MVNVAGFDIVIGNPPYVRQELLGELKNYFEARYRVYHGVADLYSYFIERGISLLNNNGIFGFIVANKWMRSNYGEPLRKWLKQQTLHEIIDFGDLAVFESATTYPCILIAGKPNKNINSFDVTNVKTLKFDSLQSYVQQNRDLLSKSSLDDKGWNLASETENNLLNKLKKNSVSLTDYVKGKIYRGVLTGLNEAFVIDEATKTQLITEDKRSEEVIKPFLGGRDIKKYQTPVIDKYLIFFPKGFTNKLGNNPKNGWKWLSENFSAVASHLKQFEESGKKRSDKGDYWWELRACDYYSEFEKPKIIYPNILKGPEFTFDLNKWYTNQKCFIISIDDKYLLGVLNSKLNYFLFEKYLPKLRGGFYEPSYVFFKNFPIKKIDLTNHKENEQKNEIVKLVDQLLQLNKEKAETKLETKVSQLETKIDYCESRINEIVYQLYELTEDEINIVEGR